MTRFLTSPDRYIKHPPVASSDLADGRPIDAATAMIMHNNLSVLSKRNVRLIGQDLGPGPFTGYTWSDKGSSPYDPFFDADLPPTLPPTDPWDRIPWTTNNCARFGPFNGVAERISVAPPGYILRKVRVHIRGVGGVGVASGKLFRIHAALVQGRNPPRSGATGIVARAVFEDLDDAAPTAYDEYLDLVPTAPAVPNAEWIARAGGGGGPVTVRVPELFVYVGWWTTNTNPANVESLTSISAFEMYT